MRESGDRERERERVNDLCQICTFRVPGAGSNGNRFGEQQKPIPHSRGNSNQATETAKTGTAIGNQQGLGRLLCPQSRGPKTGP